MTARKAHGTGADALLRVETIPIDELPPINANDAAVGAAITRKRGRPFERGNAAGKNRQPSLASVAGIPLAAADPEYKKALAWARRYRRVRVSELTRDHGGSLSSGVCAMITSSALDMAASRYLTAKAAETSDPAMMVQASKLAQSSRQQELTALELASREAAARPKGPWDPLAAFREPGEVA